MPLIFQYGSNCDSERLNSPRRLDGDATDLGRVQTVKDYDIAFNKWTTGHYAAADLLKPRNGGCHCWGILYQLSRAGFRRLIEIEGPSYRPQSILVKDATGATKSVKTFRVRLANRENNRHTSAEYVGHIVRGLRAHGVPEDYTQHVIAVAVETNRQAGPPGVEQNRLIERL